MEAIFLKLIEQLNSAVSILILILVLSFWAVYKISNIVAMFGSIREERKETKEDMKEIRKELSKISGTVDLLFEKYLSTVKSHSPLSLSAKGEDISQALQLEEKITQHWQVIKNKIEHSGPSNPYDIQERSLDFARDCFDTVFLEQQRSEIKLYAYHQGLNLLEILPIIGILIRDKYLHEKETKLEE